MPQIFDNIETKLLEGLRNVLSSAKSCSLCVGYLNLRGWGRLAELIDALPGEYGVPACRLLVGMHRPPEEEMKILQSILHPENEPIIDKPTIALHKRRFIESFKRQLEFGVPSNDAERALRDLAHQLRDKKVVIKAFLRNPLHAKLYLVERNDKVTPLIGFVGSSNLTLAGLSQQGELNVDVVEQDAARKLQKWFEDRWNDEFSLDLTDDLAQLIENSWARETLIRPYLVYIKIAYHLSEDAREGEGEFKVPAAFRDVLLDFQKAAVSLAARKIHRYGGVLLGDVVGLGKTLMATAVARVMQEDSGDNTLIICPPKLMQMWSRYLQEYKITGNVISLGRVLDELPNLIRYRLVIIDESHNLRNREGKRYRVIRDYIERNESRVLLLTATPYNKHYIDISNQLRLFLDEDQELHVRPERYFREIEEKYGWTEADFIARYQTSPSSLRAFEQSNYSEDWQDLMRLFLVRRTRQFIIKHYAKFDSEKGRYYVLLNGRPQYFPVRQPKRISFTINELDPKDQYARLFHDEVVKIIENLELPRYGLANYLRPDAARNASDKEKRVIDNLNRAGRRLIGFCRTNLFKRLESGGYSFLLSVRRHIIRNLIALYALEHGLPVPIGAQDAAILDTSINDTDEEFSEASESGDALSTDVVLSEICQTCDAATTVIGEKNVLNAYHKFSQKIYEWYREVYPDQLDWLDAKFFQPGLTRALQSDAKALAGILERAGNWDPDADAKLQALYNLITQRHPEDKILVFTQFADTAKYLCRELRKLGLNDIAFLTSEVEEKTLLELARRFSPSTNGGLRKGETPLRILIATDVLSEGQNLQDSHIVVNCDLPWAIIRLIQRAGRVDRIGQKHDTILVYSFLPADGVDRIIRLRQRLVSRLRENQEVIGTDESFFGEEAAKRLRDIYTEKADTLDDEGDDEDIDLSSLALQVWNSASEEDRKAAVALPSIASATRALTEPEQNAQNPPGVVAYLKYPNGADALIRVDEKGNLVSQSLSAIFRSIACPPDTPPLERAKNHHELVERCVRIVTEEETSQSGNLGNLRSVRRKLWERLNRYRQQLQNDPAKFTRAQLKRLDEVLNLIWRYPLKAAAQDSIRRQIRLGIQDQELFELVVRWLDEDSLCEVKEEETEEISEPKIICSLGLVKGGDLL